MIRRSEEEIYGKLSSIMGNYEKARRDNIYTNRKIWI